MMNRRKFISQTGIASAAILTVPAFAKGMYSGNNFVSKRPSVGKRKFTSKAIEKVILKTKAQIKDPELAWMFENCFPNTLDTTVEYQEINGHPDTFVITGDIHAMWLRDSTAQVWPYLPFVNEDPALKKLILGVINRQGKCIAIDPYANAFNKNAEGSEFDKDLTDMKPELHERKWEIDSLCYPVRLAYHYWKQTGDSSFFTPSYETALRLILSTFTEQLRIKGKGPYHFMRITEKATDTVTGGGYGNPVKPVGLICSAFRPSDDSTTFPFLVPSNYFAVVTLRQMAEMFSVIKDDQSFASDCNNLAVRVENALKGYAVSEHLNYGKILAFEVDGFGNQLFMDDANTPSLLSLPYLGCLQPSDSLYRNTRKFVLSADNPWFFKGKAGAGIGGPHVGEEMIWPLSLIMQAITSDDKEEIRYCLQTLKKTHAGTGFMHETFHKDNPEKFTRSWFAWANSFFGELILKVAHNYPDLLNIA
ncbi:MAG: glycoside hydrolase family 125 protein [Bacteroidota bacterium]|nr:glycoside hydrolase family 125 protein [Bacteroidota bacterium]